MSSDLQVTSLAINHLNTARKWAHFLSIFGFIICGILAIAALFIGSLIPLISQADDIDSIGVGSGILTLIYLVLAALCLMIYLYLYRFSKRVKVAIQNNDSTKLEEGFKNLGAYFRINGIILILFLIVYILIALTGIIVAIAAN